MSELRRRVERVSTVLAARSDGIKLGKFPPGRRPSDIIDLPPGFAEAAEISDGPRGGDLVVLSTAELGQQQFTVLGAEAIPDEEASLWTPFATINYEPILVNRQTGEVWWFPDTGVQWIDSTRFEKLANDIASFMVDCLLGDGYLDICISFDEWAELLIELGWANDESRE